jgi:hypothetical protein
VRERGVGWGKQDVLEREKLNITNILRYTGKELTLINIKYYILL